MSYHFSVQKGPKSCKSCGTTRRPIKGRLLCNKCYYWDGQLKFYECKLAELRTDPSKFESFHPVSVISRIRTSKRVLDELKWRESGLTESENSSDHIRCIIYALARYSNSIVGPFAHYDLESLSPESRGLMYRILLELVENLPTRLPVLHTHNLPEKRRIGDDGWWGWYHEYNRSGQAKLDHNLSRKIQDSYHILRANHSKKN
jgi:hypothetical protein